VSTFAQLLVVDLPAAELGRETSVTFGLKGIWRFDHSCPSYPIGDVRHRRYLATIGADIRTFTGALAPSRPAQPAACPRQSTTALGFGSARGADTSPSC
jgi:hypothetical protein